MKIKKITIKYLEEIIDSFVESFSDWDKKNATAYLMQSCKVSPDYCLVAVDEDDTAMGGVFCKVAPSKHGKILWIESIQVKKKFRGMNVGTYLIKEVTKIAQKKHIENIGMMALNDDNLPLSWFKKMGFKETGWIELTANVNDIKIAP